MFCPGCECEFRPGFTRCVSCDVELVESLTAVDRASVDVPREAVVEVKLAEYCGYLELADARAARDQLRAEKIHSEITIRLVTDTPVGEEVPEEYWLRVDVAEAVRVKAILESAAVERPTTDTAETSFKCSRCDRPVLVDETFCANCGTRFSA